jgi:hypothetical protein
VRTLLTLVAGGCAGILGLTGLEGAVMYLVVYFVASAILLVFMKFDSKLYTNLSPFAFITQGMDKYGLSFVLFWTLLYGLVHIY